MTIRSVPVIIRIFKNYLTIVQAADMVLFAWMIMNVGLRFQTINHGIERNMCAKEVQDHMVLQQ